MTKVIWALGSLRVHILEMISECLFRFPFQVLLNQIVLGPTVIAVIFAWNNLWQGKLSDLPNKYKKDALPTLFTGKIFKFCSF